ncbi:LOW QUALITY PROTEIN: ras and EF-hand domain-containing protein-like [Bombina bombina]|uniref:LOW QUALITY PROTEIN: ras and EF-hand domain-containing protein-like n=1 Tax=Bombina bombina TaxID=8345 RepID=UPI00235A8394|nr:LOW QUALITY PROTEIN: ras and EF-hand domain-containing protein-like [Bombina bombina]
MPAKPKDRKPRHSIESISDIRPEMTTVNISKDDIEEISKQVALSLSPQLDHIKTELFTLSVEMKNFTSRLTEIESRISDTEDSVTKQNLSIQQHDIKISEITDKIEDLENRSRRNNLKIVGLPETTNFQDLIYFASVTLPQSLEIDTKLHNFMVERAHRVGFIRNTSENTIQKRAILIKYLNFQDKDLAQLQTLFSACDVNGSGLVELEDFAAVCRDLGSGVQTSRCSLPKLDMDRDGIINFQDFSARFEEGSQTLNLSALLLPGQPPDWEELDIKLGGELQHLTSETKDQLYSLHQEIQGLSVPGLLQLYEKLLDNMSHDFRAQRLNIEKLEFVLKRTEETTAMQIAEMEEDLQNHLTKVEYRIREEDQQKLEAALQDIQRKHELELSSLQATIDRMAKNKEKLKAVESKEESTKLKNQIFDLSQENEHLRRNLLETQTSVSLLQTELDRIKNDFSDQQMQYEREKDALKVMIDESRGYSSQIQMLHEANKSLYDSNDSMRSALTNMENERKRHSSPNHPSMPERIASVLPVITYSSYAAEDDPYRRLSDIAKWADKCVDSGVSLPRSLPYSDVESSPSEFGSEHSNSSEEHWEGVSYINSDLETRSEVDGKLKYIPSRPVSRSGSSASSRRRLAAFTPKKEGLTVDGTSQASSPIYRLVLAGDAGSGKSSFLLRLCLNEFRGDIPTTLGVDFQMKKLLVDGEHTTLQIWDTAGQERFRSIAKSYFRKAHGVLLMYDVTSEASFLNVRQWIDEIKNSSEKSIPVMLIGNKTDLRIEKTESDCIQTSMGEKLAMAYSSLFCETSAKDGTNVVEAVLHLAREVKRSVDLSAERSETVTKLSIPDKKSTCCKI